MYNDFVPPLGPTPPDDNNMGCGSFIILFVILIALAKGCGIM